jgi:hypothetical protein
MFIIFFYLGIPLVSLLLPPFLPQTLEGHRTLHSSIKSEVEGVRTVFHFCLQIKTGIRPYLDDFE